MPRKRVVYVGGGPVCQSAINQNRITEGFQVHGLLFQHDQRQAGSKMADKHVFFPEGEKGRAQRQKKKKNGHKKQHTVSD